MFRQQIKSILKLLDTSVEYEELNSTRMKTFIDTQKEWKKIEKEIERKIVRERRRVREIETEKRKKYENF